MMRRMVGLSVVVTGCALIFAGSMAFAEDLPPLAPVPPEYADKKCRPMDGPMQKPLSREGRFI